MNRFRLGRWSVRRTAVLLIMVSLQAVLAWRPALAESPLPTPQETPGNCASLTQDRYTGRPVPPFTAGTVSGAAVSTSDLAFKALIIDLWGLNCASCLDEMAALEPVYQEYRDRGLRVWSVNSEGIGADRIVAGLEKKGIKVSYDLVVDPDLSVTHNFTTWFIPVTLIVDRHGMVQYYKVGFNKNDIAKIRGKVEELIAP